MINNKIEQHVFSHTQSMKRYLLSQHKTNLKV